MENHSGLEGEKEFTGDGGNSPFEGQKGEIISPEEHNFDEDEDGISKKNEDGRFTQEFLGIKDLMGISWKMLMERIWKLFVVALLYITLLVFAWTPPIIAHLVFQNLILALIFGLFSFVIFLFIVLVYNIVIIEIAKDKSIGIMNAIKKSFLKIVPYAKCMLAFIALFFLFLLPFIILGVIYAVILITVPAGVDFSVSQSLINILNWMTGILVFAYIIITVPILLLISAWQNFAFFGVVSDDKPAGKSMAYAYGMIKHRKKGIAWRIFVFLILYLAVAAILKSLPENNLAVTLVSQAVSFMMGFWMYMFSYAMYGNIKAIHGAKTDPRDIDIVRKLVKTGAAGFVLAIMTGGAMLIYAFPDFMDELRTYAENQNNAMPAAGRQYKGDDEISNTREAIPDAGLQDGARQYNDEVEKPL